jgi:hypothetical protein
MQEPNEEDQGTAPTTGVVGDRRRQRHRPGLCAVGRVAGLERSP